MKTPVLFLVFNRPDVTARVFEAVREARPERLFVAADGARADRPGEAELCAQTRAIATAIDWPCELVTLFRDENLGCRRAVSGAISWFFEHVEDGIILEDDCVPDHSFFPYCTELLARYRDDARVMCITGDNSLGGHAATRDSYSFTSFPLIWGWATWRRAWAAYDFERFQSSDYERVVGGISRDPRFVERASRNFRKTASGEIDSWGFVWSFCAMAEGGLTCIPRVNLIQNIGFGNEATHTTDDTHPRANVAANRLDVPLVHPRDICRDPMHDDAALQAMFGVQPLPNGVYKMARRWQRLKQKAGL